MVIASDCPLLDGWLLKNYPPKCVVAFRLHEMEHLHEMQHIERQSKTITTIKQFENQPNRNTNLLVCNFCSRPIAGTKLNANRHLQIVARVFSPPPYMSFTPGGSSPNPIL